MTLQKTPSKSKPALDFAAIDRDTCLELSQRGFEFLRPHVTDGDGKLCGELHGTHFVADGVSIDLDLGDWRNARTGETGSGVFSYICSAFAADKQETALTLAKQLGGPDHYATGANETRSDMVRCWQQMVAGAAPDLRRKVYLEVVKEGVRAAKLRPTWKASIVDAQEQLAKRHDRFGQSVDDLQKDVNAIWRTEPATHSNGKANGKSNGTHANGKAVAKATQSAIVAPIASETVSPEWPDTAKGNLPANTCANARAAIKALGIECRYDRFHDRALVSGHTIDQWAGELSDHACLMLRVLIRERFGFDPGKNNTSDAAVQLCLQNAFDPVLDYLDGLSWDGTPRLDAWMQRYLGALDTPLNRSIGRLALIAAVRRAREPGCKFDEIIVLEGPEGTRKSSAIEALAGRENFSDQTILGVDDKAQQEAMRGVWLYEIADLAGMSKADVDKTKAFASRVTDRARPAFGRHRIDLPRRCVFFATTNNDTYLKSQTGNRRFWPVLTTKIDIEALNRDRDQLWAEAAHHEAAKASLALPGELWADAAAEQDKRRDHDPWDDILSGVQGIVMGDEERISTADLLTRSDFLNMPADRVTDAMAKRLRYCMTRLGWKQPEGSFRINGKKVRGYIRKVTNGG